MSNLDRIAKCDLWDGRKCVIPTSWDAFPWFQSGIPIISAARSCIYPGFNQPEKSHEFYKATGVATMFDRRVLAAFLFTICVFSFSCAQVDAQLFRRGGCGLFKGGCFSKQRCCQPARTSCCCFEYVWVLSKEPFPVDCCDPDQYTTCVRGGGTNCCETYCEDDGSGTGCGSLCAKYRYDKFTGCLYELVRIQVRCRNCTCRARCR